MMSKHRGTSDTPPNQASPFTAAPPSNAPPFTAAVADGAPNPFIAAPPNAEEPKKNSPFVIGKEERAHGVQKPVRLPRRRKTAESPFEICEPEGSGFHPPTNSERIYALKSVALETSYPILRKAAPPSPFMMEGMLGAQRFGMPSQQESYQGWTPGGHGSRHYSSRSPLLGNDDPTFHAVPVTRQLELRAIFGVDREMSHEEIMQRARSLPGIRQISRVNEADIAAVSALSRVVSSLGLGNQPVKLHSGAVPIEFIHEGDVALAVETDGGFGPGIRETLIFVARELNH